MKKFSFTKKQIAIGLSGLMVLAIAGCVAAGWYGAAHVGVEVMFGAYVLWALGIITL